MFNKKGAIYLYIVNCLFYLIPISILLIWHYAIVQDQIKQKKEAAQFLESGNPFHKNLCEKRSI